MTPQLEILNEEIIYQNGNNFKRVRRWLKGVHPHLGTIIKGYTGLETVIEQDIILPSLKVTIS